MANAMSWKVLRVRVCGQWFKRKDFAFSHKNGKVDFLNWEKFLRVVRPFDRQVNANCFIYGAEAVKETRVHPIGGRQVRIDIWQV